MVFVGTENLSGSAAGDNGKSGTPSKSASPKDGSPAPSGLAKVIQMALNVTWSYEMHELNLEVSKE